MNTAAAFFTALFITVALMLAALWTGLRRHRRPHLWLGPLCVLGLVIAVLLALQLGREYAFPPGPMSIHRVFATAAGLLGVLVALTGLLLLRRPGARIWHRRIVFGFVATALGATGTGLWMWTGAVPK